MTRSRFLPVILCGGSGSRLWPVSRELHPKPFIKLADGQSMLQKAFLLASALPNVEEVLIITNKETFFKVEDELLTVNTRQQKMAFILEPVARNTAAAAAMAALYAAERNDPDTVMLVMPADHLILDTVSFQNAVAEAVGLAKQNKLVTFGIKPSRPETGYGYIESDKNKVIRFVEKPSYAVADEYVASGRFLWNSGIFCFNSRTILEQMDKHCPNITNVARLCMNKSPKDHSEKYTQINLDSGAFFNMPSESIDYAVMEKSSCMAVVPCDIGWRDIGSWSAMSELSESDSQGNSVEGTAMFYDTQNCHVQSKDRMVATVGVDNLIVIDTPDAVLVATRHRAEDVRHLYSQLKTEGHEVHRLHRTVHRPWGTYTVLEEGEGFKIKRIEVKPGASLSLQMHRFRSEHWIVVSGRAKVVNGENEFFVETNQSTYIPAGHCHRLSNATSTQLIIIEVQSGEYLGEDDIVRLEDMYGRA